MDEIDLEILKCLRSNARESLGKIAEDLGISKATVSRRISKMEMEGYIAGYTLTTNSSKVGVMRAFLGLQVVGSGIDLVVEELRHFPEVEFIYKVFGDHSLICIVYTKSVDNLYELIQNKILKIPHIRNVEVDILVDRLPLNPDAEFDTISSQFVMNR